MSHKEEIKELISRLSATEIKEITAGIVAKEKEKARHTAIMAADMLAANLKFLGKIKEANLVIDIAGELVEGR